MLRNIIRNSGNRIAITKMCCNQIDPYVFIVGVMCLRGDLLAAHQILRVSYRPTTSYYFNYTICYSSFGLNEMKVNDNFFERV